MTSGDGSSESSSSKASKTSKKPKYTNFSQQEVPACLPILTPVLVIGILISNALIFIPIGLCSISASEKVVEVVDRYDDVCVPSKVERGIGFIQDPDTNKSCSRTLTVPKKMKHPIYVYYELDNYHQNHRRYVRSRSDPQLWGSSDESASKLCVPIVTDNNRNQIVPCGLIAWSLFKDTYKFSRNDNPLDINRKDISWNSDRTKKFGSNVYPKNFQSHGLIGGAKLNESIPLSEQDDLIVWMRTAALPNFRKLYGRIETDLEANETITVTIQNNYNTYSFNGKKKLVISTATWIGGKNDLMGRMYMTVGGASLCFAILFTLLLIIKPRSLGDPNCLSWNINPTMR